MKMKPNTSHRLCLGTCLLVVFAAAAGVMTRALGADVINVNYTGNASAAMHGVWSYDVAARGTAGRAAPLAYLGNTWNDFNSPTAVGTNLLDSVGAPIGVDLVTTMEGGLWTDWNGLGGARLLKSPVASSFTDYKPAFKLTGLKPSHTYDLYIASVHNNNNNPQDFRVGGDEKHVSNGGRITNWVEGQNYIRFAGLKSAGNGTMTVEGKGRQVIINGFQLVDNDASTPKSPDKNVFTFGFGELGQAKISGTDITIDVLWGTAVNKLAPTITFAERATVSPVSGSVNDFTGPVTYTVTAEDGSTRSYRVAVTILPKSSAKDILACSFGTFGTAVIDGDNINMPVPVSQSLKNLAPEFTIPSFATITPASGSVNDFTKPVTYTVTAQDGTTKVYKVTAQTYAAWAHSASLCILTTPDGANLPASASETNFPILVRLNTGNFNFAQAKPRGEDLRFSTAAGARLSYQIDQWDPTDGVASIWVKIPVIAGNASQQIKMHWGKADAAAESNGGDVFNESTGYASVLHMDEALKDEVGSVVPNGEGATTAVAGVIGTGRHFVPGKGINCGDHIKTYPYSDMPFTSELWFRAEMAGATLFSWGRYATRYNGFTGDGNLVDISLRSPASLGWASDGPGGVSAKLFPIMNQWYHVAATYSDGISRIYVNGQLEGTNYHRAAMSLMNDIYMNIGGQFVGDIDEVRVSRVARSDDWVKMEYENQKAMQTLVGPPAQEGGGFSVTPASVKMNEGSNLKIVGQAGGAQKLYWICKKGREEKVMAVDQFTLDYPAGRVVGDQSFVLQFKAVYPDGVKIKDIPVTIKEHIPDPIYSVAAPTMWNGRKTITVTPKISNWSALQASGATNFVYRWNVGGVAVIKQITPGTLTLIRAQGSGRMTVTLVFDNGGASITNTAVINVKEPAKDAWLVRIPEANEKPMDGQFYARDDKNEGTLYYNGTLSDAIDSVFLKVYADNKLFKNESQKITGDKVYAFTVKLTPGLIKYKVEFGTKTGDAETVVRTVTNLLCGDAYLLDGQSNTVADNKGGPHGMYKSEWIRSFGGMSGGSASGWGNAVASSADGDAYRIGYWGVALADRLVKAHKIPICMINGAVGGTRIDQHQRNESDPEDQNTIYGRILARVKAARLTHGIRGVLWHQGENNSGAAAPTGDWDYKSYQQYFVDMSAAWKQDYPNIRNYYVYQIWPLPCGMGPKGAQIREAQRTLPRLYSNMSVMSTIGIINQFNGRGLCHFDWDGYEQFATLMGPLVERDNYGMDPSLVRTAPDLKKAYYTTSQRDEIALEFGHPMAWDNVAAKNFYLDGVKGQVVSGSVSGNVIKLQLAGPSKATSIDYLADNDWDGSSKNLLWGSEGIAALTFCEVPIATSSR